MVVTQTGGNQELEKRIGHDELLQAHLNRSFTLYKPPIALRKTGATRRVDHKTRNTGPHLGATTRVEHKTGVYDVPAPSSPTTNRPAASEREKDASSAPNCGLCLQMSPCVFCLCGGCVFFFRFCYTFCGSLSRYYHDTRRTWSGGRLLGRRAISCAPSPATRTPAPTPAPPAAPRARAGALLSLTGLRALLECVGERGGERVGARPQRGGRVVVAERVPLPVASAAAASQWRDCGCALREAAGPAIVAMSCALSRREAGDSSAASRRCCATTSSSKSSGAAPPRPSPTPGWPALSTSAAAGR